jgi:pSer/pThr/pTyr-binding forkhead associated (FHA) protein
MKVEELEAIARALPEAEFLERYPDPALLVSASLPPAPAGGRADLVEVCALTDDQIPLPGRSTAAGSSPRRSLEVAFLKAPILVGRGGECDIRFAASSVSMIHASLEPAKEGWTVTDRSSTNGTTLDGKRLAPDAPAKLVDGARIGFGADTIATFLSSRRLRAYLRGNS